jgi:hypothetical protein
LRAAAGGGGALALNSLEGGDQRGLRPAHDPLHKLAAIGVYHRIIAPSL